MNQQRTKLKSSRAHVRYEIKIESELLVVVGSIDGRKRKANKTKLSAYGT
jgi:hypothetical protein